MIVVKKLSKNFGRIKAGQQCQFLAQTRRNRDFARS